MLQMLAKDGYVALKSEKLKSYGDGVTEQHVKNLLYSKILEQEVFLSNSCFCCVRYSILST